MTLDLVTTAPSEGQSRVTEEHRRIFAADGVVKIEGAVDSQWTSRLLALADDRLAHPGKWVGDSAASGSAGRVFTERYLWRDNATVKDFVFGSGVAALAGQVMGVGQVRFYFDHLLVKEPGTADPTPWHQDIPYWPFLGKQICSVWVSATDLTVQESSLEFVRGSHRWDRYFTPKAFTKSGSGWAEANKGDEVPDIDGARHDFDVVGFDVKAGDALVFSAWSVHGAPGNAGDTRRVALSTRWLGDDAVWSPRPASDPAVTQADTTVTPGQYPADDDRFPIGWRAER